MQSESYPPLGWRLLTVVLLCAVSIVTLPVSAQKNTESKRYFVLLRNGEVIHGQLDRDGDHYLVRRGGNAVLRIPYKDISHVGPNLDSLYQHKANRIVEFRADEHLDLASWCLQNGLEAHTTHHILRAETIDPLHPHLSLLKARLERNMTNARKLKGIDNKAALMSAIGQQPIPFDAAPVRPRPSQQTEKVQTSRKGTAAPTMNRVAAEQANSLPQASPDPDTVVTHSHQGNATSGTQPSNVTELKLADEFTPVEATLTAPKLIPTEPPPLSSVQAPRLVAPRRVPKYRPPKVDVDLIQGIEQNLAQATQAIANVDTPSTAQITSASPPRLPFLSPPITRKARPRDLSKSALDRQNETRKLPVHTPSTSPANERPGTDRQHATRPDAIAETTPSEPGAFQADNEKPLNAADDPASPIDRPNHRTKTRVSMTDTVTNTMSKPARNEKRQPEVPRKARPNSQISTNPPRKADDRQNRPASGRPRPPKQPWPIQENRTTPNSSGLVRKDTSPATTTRPQSTKNQKSREASQKSIVVANGPKGKPPIPFSPAPQRSRPPFTQQNAAKHNEAKFTRTRRSPATPSTLKPTNSNAHRKTIAVNPGPSPSDLATKSSKFADIEFMMDPVPDVSKQHAERMIPAESNGGRPARARANAEAITTDDQNLTAIQTDPTRAVSAAQTAPQTAEPHEVVEQKTEQLSNRYDISFESPIIDFAEPTKQVLDELAKRPEPDPIEPKIEMAPELIRAYVTNIQPMLLTRCAAGNCHGPDSSRDFRLHEMANQRPSRKMTMRNLAAIMKQTNPDDIANSPIITWGASPHGDTNSKLLAIADVDQKRMLLHWLQDATTHPTDADADVRDRDEILAHRREIFSEGAERISIRKFKKYDVEWEQTVPDTVLATQPEQKKRRSVEFATRPITRK